jgi:hypothetical protein
MLKRIPILILLASSILNSFAQLPREVWFDPTGTALASGGATGSLSNPLGGSGTSFDANMVFLTSGASGTPTYPNLVIHLKAGTYTTYGHKHPGYGSG